MNLLRRIVAVMLLPVLGQTLANAQEQFTGNVEADVVSQYVWRGLEKGGFSIQPKASLSWQGLSLMFMGSTGFRSTDAKEINLGLQYSRWGFNIGVTDYWVTGIEENDLYFHYEKKGAHQLEGNIGFTCDYFKLQAYTFFWGNDFKTNGKQAYSTYIELGVPFQIGGIDWLVTAGMTPFESAGTSYIKQALSDRGNVVQLEKADYTYAEGPSCVLASLRATKKLDIGFAQIPVFAEFNANPYLQRAYMIFGVTITPFQ